MKTVFDIVTSPLITEKGTLVNEHGNQFVFRVRRDANKDEIRHAVETLFKVKVEKVRTLNLLGKTRRVGKHAGPPAGRGRRPTSRSPRASASTSSRTV